MSREMPTKEQAAQAIMWADAYNSHAGITAPQFQWLLAIAEWAAELDSATEEQMNEDLEEQDAVSSQGKWLSACGGYRAAERRLLPPFAVKGRGARPPARRRTRREGGMALSEERRTKVLAEFGDPIYDNDLMFSLVRSTLTIGETRRLLASDAALAEACELINLIADLLNQYVGESLYLGKPERAHAPAEALSMAERFLQGQEQRRAAMSDDKREGAGIGEGRRPYLESRNRAADAYAYDVGKATSSRDVVHDFQAGADWASAFYRARRDELAGRELPVTDEVIEIDEQGRVHVPAVPMAGRELALVEAARVVARMLHRAGFDTTAQGVKLDNALAAYPPAPAPADQPAAAWREDSPLWPEVKP